MGLRRGTMPLGVVVLLCCASLAWGQRSDEPKRENDSAAKVRDWAQAAVKRLELRDVTTGELLLKTEGSLLRWSNPIVGDVYGDSYLWTLDARPQAFLSIYARYDKPSGNRRLTFQSLSEHALEARFDKRVVWNPEEGGIRFVAVPGTRPPSLNRALRRSRMTRLARELRGAITEQESSKMRELRLLTTPLYRYDNLDDGILDGGLYAFVDGTDPEILLLVEAHVANDTRNWRMSYIRQNHRALQLKRGDTVVWNAPALAPPFPNPRISDPTGVYYNTKWAVISQAP